MTVQELKDNLYKAVVDIIVANQPAPPPTTTTTLPPVNTTTSTTTTTTVAAGLPSAILGRKWTVMAPFNKLGATDSPENLYIAKAELDSRYTPVMYKKGSGVAFKTTAGGVHSANSKYPRTELREMVDENWNEAAWSATSGTHSLEVSLAINHNLVKRPQTVCVQIHDSSDDVMQVALDGPKLVVFYNDKANVVELEPNYVKGSIFKIKIAVSGGHIKVFYNDVQKADIAKSGSSWYFKTGTYLQSNVTDWGEAPDAYAETTLSNLKVTHA